MGTTQSTTILPASGSASSRRMSACPAYGTATITRSAAPATSTFAPPVTETSAPPAADAARSATPAAIREHFSASRDPSRIRCPVAANRTASPRPWGPVPPMTPTTSSSTARPSVTSPILPRRPGRPVSRPPRRGPRSSTSPPARRPTAARARLPRGWRTAPAGAARRSRPASPPCGASGSRTRAPARPCAPLLSSVGSAFHHDLVVAGVERRPRLRGQVRRRAAAVAQLRHLGEEVLPCDPRREQDQERRLLVAVVAEAVHPGLVHQGEVPRAVGLPPSARVDRQLPGQHVERLRESLVVVRP